jgi:inner membrane protein
MASIGHVALGLAGRRFYQGRGTPPGRPALAGAVIWSALSLLPDADVIAFRLGIPYEAPWGHRGATHSLCFAALIALLAVPVARWARLPVRRTAAVVLAVVASHGIADAFTDGGLGSALLWPFSNERYFAPWTPIPVAPIGLGFLSRRGLRVAAVELLLFAPVFLYALWPRRGARSG